MLRVTSLEANYSGIRALRGVSLEVKTGEMVALIGPNGAGKSTLLNCLSGIVPPAAGSILLDGQECSGERPWTISRRGLLHCPEGRQILPEMTVLENLQLGLSALGTRPAAYPLERVYSLFPILEERAMQLAGSLSGGQQQMLAIGRALMGAPRLLLLDEPSLGAGQGALRLPVGRRRRRRPRRHRPHVQRGQAPHRPRDLDRHPQALTAKEPA